MRSFQSLLLSSFMVLFALSSLAQQTGNVVYFDLNVPTVSAVGKHTIDDLVTSGKISKTQHLLLYGYADYLGTRAHNDSLSTERAMNVRAYLLSKGILADNVTICVGRGAVERQPRTDHKGYAQDRKVEIITDAKRIKSLSCRPLKKYEALQWSKNVGKLNVRGRAPYPADTLSDETVSVMLPNGDKYIGEIDKDGNKVTGGTYIWANGEVYRGGFNSDLKEGHGTYYWPDGDVLDGTWGADTMMYGNLTIPYDGVLYHADDAHTNSGTTYRGALQYKGSFANHGFNGYGIAIWPNGDKYQGSWNNDNMQGEGTYYWSNRTFYTGHWENNKMDGHGSLYDANGNVIQSGIWANDVFSGHN